MLAIFHRAESMGIVRKQKHTAAVDSQGISSMVDTDESHSVVSGRFEVSWYPPEDLSLLPALVSNVYNTMTVSATETPGLADMLAQLDVPSDSFRQSHVVGYHSNGGSGNRVQSLITSLLVAAVTGRSLLVGPFTSGHNQGRNCPYTSLLTIRGFPVVTEETFPCEDCTASNLPFGGGACGIDLVETAKTLKSSQDTKLIFPDYWGFYTATFSPGDIPIIAKFVDQHVDFSNEILKATAGIIAGGLPKRFAAIHFRLGDRHGQGLADCAKFGMTMGLEGPLNDTYEAQCEALGEVVSLGNWSTGYLANFMSCPTFQANGKVMGLSTERVFKDWQLPQGLSHVYLATNEPTDPRVLHLIAQGKDRGLTFIMWGDLDADLLSRVLPESGLECSEPRGGTFLSEIEQGISIHAEVFLPAWPSSWDEFVITKRLAKGKPDAPLHAQLMYKSMMQMIRMTRRSIDEVCPSVAVDNWLF